MKIILSLGALLSGVIVSSQKVADTIKQENIEAVNIVARKPTVENKADRTIFNVANSSILAGNTTWDVLRMTPLVSIDNNDVIKSEGEAVTVYINDRKSVFTGKDLKEYLKTLPAENLMKIEVITSPSSRYETSGQVINIVLKKRDDEGLKGSATFTNTQNTKNNQYANFNINYHKKSFTQTLTASYGDYTNVMKNYNVNLLYENNAVSEINTESTQRNKMPSFSSTSELELNDKNSVGFIFEYSQNNRQSFAQANGINYLNSNRVSSYVQDQNLTGVNRTIGSNIFYKYYDKEKSKILDVNLGINYNSQEDTNDHVMNLSTNSVLTGTRIVNNTQERNYYLKVDYSQPLGKAGNNLEVGGKLNINNNAIPYNFYALNNGDWTNDRTRSNNFRYSDDLSYLYGNYSQTFFEKLEARIGIRYEYITQTFRQEVGNEGKKDSYGTFLPNLLLKYNFSENYNLSASYNHNLWRPYYSEFNPFLLPNDDGTFYRGNMNLLPNPSERFVLKLGLFKKYFISTTYWFSNQDYWGTYAIEDGKTISYPENFHGRVERYSVNFNTNQTFLKNKLSVNLNLGINYSDNSDFNTKNNLDVNNYVTNFGGSTNISYTNLFNKNINLNGWFGLFTQNNGNTIGNSSNFYHTISVTKIFPKLEMETSLQLNNIFLRPNYDATTYTPIGTFRNSMKYDWYGISLTLVKRFGNQKVKQNSKTNLEKNEGGAK